MSLYFRIDRNILHQAQRIESMAREERKIAHLSGKFVNRRGASPSLQ
ncbi:hypothetical protein [Paenibacillus sp.]|nr:hypothetical protein [Paenibacillus sp.]HZG55011.1 hypothetical protein [Paenibacillus sp.]